MMKSSRARVATSLIWMTCSQHQCSMISRHATGQGTYTMTWPLLRIAPSDTVISRIVRELVKRTLGVREVLKIRMQSRQQKAVRKRTKVAEGLEMVSSTAEQDAAPTLHNYMTNLLTLMIAYSKAGSKLRADAPPSET